MVQHQRWFGNMTMTWRRTAPRSHGRQVSQLRWSSTVEPWLASMPAGVIMVAALTLQVRGFEQHEHWQLLECAAWQH